ncbi:YvrJ family protein [Radiobacillus deserti]|uniref:YvrJ family protein n=1 Tax=Radiobacillus deserti TaxID=2594883 RepID=A0A516KJC5_9BACI|nr:YvrJ family protein [Radiobacillus deserti]QDP41472.1 YvrJ family protein [Radiobacillus deserti]
MEDTWLSLIKEVGFPIAVTFYLLHRIEGKLNTLIESIMSLPDRLK